MLICGLSKRGTFNLTVALEMQSRLHGSREGDALRNVAGSGRLPVRDRRQEVPGQGKRGTATEQSIRICRRDGMGMNRKSGSGMRQQTFPRMSSRMEEEGIQRKMASDILPSDRGIGERPQHGGGREVREGCRERGDDAGRTAGSSRKRIRKKAYE